MKPTFDEQPRFNIDKLLEEKEQRELETGVEELRFGVKDGQLTKMTYNHELPADVRRNGNMCTNEER